MSTPWKPELERNVTGVCLLAFESAAGKNNNNHGNNKHFQRYGARLVTRGLFVTEQGAASPAPDARESLAWEVVVDDGPASRLHE